jgi:hypothetical protein
LIDAPIAGDKNNPDKLHYLLGLGLRKLYYTRRRETEEGGVRDERKAHSDPEKTQKLKKGLTSDENTIRQNRKYTRNTGYVQMIRMYANRPGHDHKQLPATNTSPTTTIRKNSPHKKLYFKI